MNIKSCETKEKCEVEIIVEIGPEEFDAAVNKSFIKNRKSVTIPGFRRGKAPRKIIERMLGATTFHPDAFEMLLPDVLQCVEEGHEFNAVGDPQITDVKIIEEGGGAEFTVIIIVSPEVEVGEYKGLTAVLPDSEVPESDVDSEIGAVRQRNARMEVVDRPANEGDTVLIDYEGFIDGEPFEGGKGENHELELGSNRFIPGFEEKLVGISVGEEREIDLVFPDAYAEHLASKPVVFKVKANEIREKQLPDLDDDFAMDVSQFDTFEEYKQDIRDRLEKEKKDAADAAFEEALVSKLVESTEIEVPDVMVEEQFEITMKGFKSQLASYGMSVEQYLQMMNITPAMFQSSMQERSKKEVKVALVLGKIAVLEGIEVSDEELEEYYKKASESSGIDLDDVKERVDEKKVINEIKMRGAAKIVMDSAVPLSPEHVPDHPEPKDEGRAATDDPVQEAPDPEPKGEGEAATDDPVPEAPDPKPKGKGKAAAKDPKPKGKSKAATDDPESESKPTAKKPAAKPKKAAAKKEEPT